MCLYIRMENVSSAVYLDKEQHQCRFVHSSAPADVVTIIHLEEMKFKEVTLTAHGRTTKNQMGNAQKYKIGGPGKNKTSHRYISLYLFVLHFDSTSQITLGNEILQIFPLLWDKKQKPVMHKVLNAFTSSMLYVRILNIINMRTLNQLVLVFLFLTSLLQIIAAYKVELKVTYFQYFYF